MISPLFRLTHKVSSVYLELEDLQQEALLLDNRRPQVSVLFDEARDAVAKIQGVLNNMENSK